MRAALPSRRLVAFVVIAVTLSTHGGSVIASTTSQAGLSGPSAVVASSARGAGARVVGVGAAAGTGRASPVAEQGAVAAPRVLARAAILADEATGQVLFQRNADAARAMASTTKVMTALLVLERLDERRIVVIGSGPPKVGEESLRLREGERLTVRQLLLGLLVKSANDAGVALAEAVDGSEAAFVRRMNRRAAALRLSATRYVTPYGLDRPGHQTSARDLARLWEVAMRRADFRSLVATRAVRLPGGPLALRRFVTTNQLLGSYRWTVGGKTGFTNRAGRCLVASASRGGRRLVAVALGSPNAFADVRALFEHGFSKFVRARLAEHGQPVSASPGRPASLQVGADADALVRLDHLDQVRLSVPAGSASGGAGTAGSGPVRAWFTGGGRRLVAVRLVRGSAAGPAPTTTLASPAGTVGPVGGILTPGTAVPVRPVPAGSSAPVIDPLLRREPA
jgi:D-alanyl-D-alanine carboxypeptidase (penicillin-binding protein 5/6)